MHKFDPGWRSRARILSARCAPSAGHSVEVLATEEDHQMAEPGTSARRDRAVIKVCREIDFGDLDPERAGDRTDLTRTMVIGS